MIKLSVALDLFIMSGRTVGCIYYFLTCAGLDSQFEMFSLHGLCYVKP